MMTEKEKMIAGKLYDPSDKELVALRAKAHRLSKEYNELLETDERRVEIIKELGMTGDSFYLQGPVQFDYGCFTSIGTNSYANFNFTCVDCCPVTIGENVFWGPNVSLLTPIHPLRWQDRNQYIKKDGTPTNKEYATNILGVTYNKQPNSYITWLPSSSQNVHVRIVQHELSHMFGAHDASCSQNQPCVMKGSYDGKSLTGYTDIWCDNCKADFERDLY